MFAQFITPEVRHVNKALLMCVLLETSVCTIFLFPAIQIYDLPAHMATQDISLTHFNDFFIKKTGHYIAISVCLSTSL